ncbi:MAG: leader peptide processing enzyme [Treponema sp.]|nr:leader peptide processing enzyme [Treponema sp.]
MNKKVNTLLFVLGGTLFNVIIALLCMVLLFVLLTYAAARFFPGTEPGWIVPFSLLAGIVSSFFIYRAVIKTIIKKIDLEKYLDPLFVKTNIRKNKTP